MRCQWVEKQEGEKRFRQCEERATHELDDRKYCQVHLKAVQRTYPGSRGRELRLGKIILLDTVN